MTPAHPTGRIRGHAGEIEREYRREDGETFWAVPWSGECVRVRALERVDSVDDRAGSRTLTADEIARWVEAAADEYG